MSVGTEWLVEALGCDPSALRDREALERVCRRILGQLELSAIGEGHWHRFPDPGGLTGLYLLTESHLALHTYPEHGIATLNLYCCSPRRAWPWRAELRQALGAAVVRVRRCARGEARPPARRGLEMPRLARRGAPR